MKYKVKGEIIEVGEVQTLKNGAKSLYYLLKSENEWDKSPWKIDVYYPGEKMKFFNDFLTYNKVGDVVETQFFIKPSEWNGKYYISLSHFSSERISQGQNNLPESKTKYANEFDEAFAEDDDIPF